jgi:uncharacterized protein involved in exopolysaccharide biosynthesis
MNEKEPSLMDLFLVLWKRRWLIVLPTLGFVLVAGIGSFFLPKKYEVDAIIQPSKMFIQTEQGEFEEVVVIDPKQTAGQINQESYNRLIAAQLNIDIRKFPRIRAENLRDTNLVLMMVTEQDIERGKAILSSLFEILKKDFNKKIEVELKGLDSRIATSENEIKIKELDIQSKDIEKAKKRQEIASAGNTLKISEQWSQSIVEELKSVKKRVDEIEAQQREMLKESVEGISAIGLLLYSSEIQQNLRYYNTLDEKLSDERVKQENLKLSIRSGEEDLKLLSTDVERLKKEIENLKNQINLLTEYKGRIDYAELIKEPTASLFPVSPKKLFNTVIAGLVGLAIFISLAFFLEFLEKQKPA